MRCPSSECWDYDEVLGRCLLKSDSRCFDVFCHQDKMIVYFKSALLGVSDADSNQQFGVPDRCKPVWNGEYNRWVYTNYLGDCDQEIATAQCTDDGLVCRTGRRIRGFHDFITFDVALNKVAKAVQVQSLKLDYSIII